MRNTSTARRYAYVERFSTRAVNQSLKLREETREVVGKRRDQEHERTIRDFECKITQSEQIFISRVNI